MTRWTLIVVSLVVFGICQTGLLAVVGEPPVYCPPGSLFCDNFDTYCAGGGYPGGAGDPADPPCGASELPTTAGNDLLHAVWSPTSTDEFTGNACGDQMTLLEYQTAIPFYTGYPPYQINNFSAPFGGKSPALGSTLLPQHTLKDWEPPNPYGLSRLIGNAFGTQYNAVTGTDENPLVLSYYVSGDYLTDGPGLAGKIWYSNGYIELAYGDQTYLNRANTDYVFGPNCSTYCSPYINQGPHPILCALGNPENGLPLPVGCPANPTTTAPLHHALAIGIVANVDPDPCHCGSAQAHGGQNYHPVFFDGQVWWNLRKNSPMISTGTALPVNGAPMPQPPRPEINEPSRFTLWGGQNNPSSKCFNWITLTIKTSTLKVELTTQETSIAGNVYLIYSSMDNLPRRYTGPFDRLRSGFGGDCALASNASWDTCTSGTGRSCMHSLSNQGRYVDFDDLTLSGGIGYSDNGACCVPNTDCVNGVTQAHCEAAPVDGGLGGHFQGTSTTCSTVTCCPFPPYVFADADHDGDVDQDDFGMFQVCYTGTGGGVPAGCSCLNRNGDGGIDNLDFIAFKNCWSGPNVPWTPGGLCAP